jgi:tetratricopeptide (TPR) repeat protein
VLDELIQDEEPAERIKREWARLTPKVFAAAATGSCAKVPGVIRFFSSVERPGERLLTTEALALLGKLQALVWIRLAQDCGARIRTGARLMGEIRRFVDPKIILPSAVPRLLEWISGAQRGGFTGLTAYATLAVGAGVCAAAEVKNPHVAQWALEYLKFEIERARGRGDKGLRARPAITNSFAAATVPFAAAWNATADVLSDEIKNTVRASEGQVVLDAIGRALECCGHRGLLEHILLNSRFMVRGNNKVSGRDGDRLAPLPDDVESVIGWLKGYNEAAGDIQQIVDLASMLCEPMVEGRRTQDLEKVADALFLQAAADEAGTAVVTTWIATRLNRLREPEQALRRVKEKPAVWEKDIDPRLLVPLLTERSNALRLLGRVDEALSIASSVQQICIKIGQLGETLTADRNVAILLRDTGAPDAALPILQRLEASTPSPELPDLLESLAITYHAVDQHHEAAETFRRARELTSRVNRAKITRFKALEALARANARDNDEAVRLLSELTAVDAEEPMTVLAQAMTVVLLLTGGLQLPDSIRVRVKAISSAIRYIFKTARLRSDNQLALSAMGVAALLATAIGHPLAEARWRYEVKLADGLGISPNPIGLIFLAMFAFQRSNAPEACRLLERLIEVLSKQYGSMTDVDAVLGSLRGLQRWMIMAAQAAIDCQVLMPADFRLLAEAGRSIGEVSRRARRPDRARRSEGGLTRASLDDQELIRLTPLTGSLGVLEWIDVGRAVPIPQLTIVQAGGTVRAVRPVPPSVDLPKSAVRVRTRLSNWYEGRPGDPFDDGEWSDLESWTLSTLGAELAPGDHVVFFDAPRSAGLPWHVAAASQFPSSYASGWSALFDATKGSPDRSDAKLGLVAVPRWREPDVVVRAFRNSLDAVRLVAGKLGMPILEAIDEVADSAAVQNVLSGSGFAYLLCHGFVSPIGDEVALMLAAEGRLPPASSVAADTKIGRRHRLSWRTIGQLAHAPETIVSAACSTGLGPEAGLGDRVGLFASLRPAGTRSLVAPLWDSIAIHATEIASGIIERRLVGGEPLGAAVWNAGKAAAGRLPRWISWNLALEGDWR